MGGPSNPVLPTLDDAVLAAASPAVGGIAGRRVRPDSGWWTALRVCLALTLVASIVALARMAPCSSDGWTGGDQFVAGCYSDIGTLYPSRGIESGTSPFDSAAPDGALEYPVLTTLTVALTAGAVDLLDRVDGQRSTPPERTRLFFLLNALLLLSAWVIAVGLTSRAAGWRPWDAALLAVAPGVILAGLINWDLLAVAFTAGALLCLARNRPVLAGVLLGLGASTKLYPVFLLLPVLVIALRRGEPRRFARVVAGFVPAWLVVNLPLLLTDLDAWARFYTFSAERGPSWGSIWYAAGAEGWFDLSEQLNWLGPLLFGLGCAGVAVLAWRAPLPPRVGQLAFLVVAVFLLVNKVYSPQYVVWLAALLPLARPRWGAALAWSAAEAVYFVAIWAQLQGVTQPDLGIPEWPHSWATVLRMVALGLLMALIVRDVLRPDLDVVTATSPAGAPTDPLWPPVAQLSTTSSTETVVIRTSTASG
jgi:uncharacterized membrane protein